jgi:TonB family protein
VFRAALLGLALAQAGAVPVRLAGSVQAPETKTLVRPILPALAGDVPARTGSTVVEVTVDEAGAVSDARILRSADPALDDAVLAATRNWTFSPARAGVGGDPPPARAQLVALKRMRDARGTRA